MRIIDRLRGLFRRRGQRGDIAAHEERRRAGAERENPRNIDNEMKARGSSFSGGI